MSKILIVGMVVGVLVLVYRVVDNYLAEQWTRSTNWTEANYHPEVKT